MGTAVVRLCLALVLLFSFATHAWTVAARAVDTPTTNDREAEIEAAWDAAVQARIVGPKRIDLLDQAILDLPAGYAFVPAAEAARLMRARGEHTETTVGIIWSEVESAGDWDIYVEFANVGYVRDDCTVDWKPI